jgi:hypothetical protein
MIEHRVAEAGRRLNTFAVVTPDFETTLRRRHRVRMVAVAGCLATLALVGVLLFTGQGGFSTRVVHVGPAATSPPQKTPPLPAPTRGDPNSGVWPNNYPGPARLRDLVDEFAHSVLHWSPYAVEGVPETDPTGPTWITIRQNLPAASVSALAVPVGGHWTFMQVGSPPLIHRGPTGNETVVEPGNLPPGTKTLSIDIEVVDGSHHRITLPADKPVAPLGPPVNLIKSVTIVFQNGEGTVIGANAGAY